MRKVKSPALLIARLIVEPLTEREAVATGATLRLPRSYSGRMTLGLLPDGSISPYAISIGGTKYRLVPS